MKVAQMYMKIKLVVFQKKITVQGNGPFCTQK